MARRRKSKSVGSEITDPSQNVLDTLHSEVRRQDDLRKAEARHGREIADLHAKYQEKLDVKETERIDANRLFDQLEVKMLAGRREQDVEAQRQLVQNTAKALETSQGAQATGFNERIAKLEERSYKGEGRGGGISSLYGWVLTASAAVLTGCGVGIAGLALVAGLIYFLLSHK